MYLLGELRTTLYNIWASDHHKGLFMLRVLLLGLPPCGRVTRIGTWMGLAHFLLRFLCACVTIWPVMPVPMRPVSARHFHSHRFYGAFVSCFRQNGAFLGIGLQQTVVGTVCCKPFPWNALFCLIAAFTKCEPLWLRVFDGIPHLAMISFWCWENF